MDQQDFTQALSQDEDGQPEPPVILVNLREDGGLWSEMTVSRLEACGIPVLRQYPWSGSAVRLYLGTACSGVDLYVPASRLEEARQLLDTGPEDIP